MISALPPRAPLALALATSLLAAVPIRAAQTPDTSWIRFRTDAAHRIFDRLAPPHRARAASPNATLAVTNCNDDGAGSLRQAVAAAADSDTIDLSALSCGTITLQTGAIPVMLDNLTLKGPGRAALAVDGNAADRAFIHPYGGTLSLQSMTIRNGRDRATGFHVAGGGCVASAGYVEIIDGAISNCYAGGEGAYGGALYAYALTLTRSTLSGNVAKGVHDNAGTAAFGGAAFVYQMTLVDSTVSGNRAIHEVNPGYTSYDIGGGIITIRGGYVSGSTIDSNTSQERGGGLVTFNPIAMSNSTVSGNVAAGGIGGGLLLRWPAVVELHNSTVTANSASLDGGGIWLNVGGSQFNSSILWGNSSDVGNGSSTSNPAAPFSIGGAGNLIGTASAGVTLPSGTLTANPLLGPLADNGGPTRTHALLRGSPAVDAGSNTGGLAFDQRGTGYPRVYGAAADIGAFEQQALPALPVPALSQWTPWLLAGVVVMLAMLRLRRKSPAREVS